MSKKILTLISTVLILLLIGGGFLIMYGMNVIKEVDVTTDDTSNVKGTIY